MTGGTRLRNLAVGVAAVGVLAAGWVPASAGPGPVPPACDPTVSGIGVPGCPGVLVGEVGDLENPTIELPDLRPDTTEVYVTYETIELDQTTGQWIFGPAILNFDTHSQNMGAVPVELRAEEPESLLDGSPVSQCVSWTTNLVCRQREIVGGFTWHQEHLHFHYEGFGRYELRELDANGDPDWSAPGLISESPKVSFCLIDSLRVRADANPASRYHTCNPLEEGISAGWADIYPTGIAGQALSLDGVSDGRYALVIALNSTESLFETDHSNNRVVATVEVSNLGQFNPLAGIVDKRYM